MQSAAALQGAQPAWGWCSQTPVASQMSAVQAVPSPQSAAVVHGTQPGMAESWQLPSLPQASVVQGF